MGLYKRALCEFSSVITRFRITFVSRNKYKNFGSTYWFFFVSIFYIVYKIFQVFNSPRILYYTFIYNKNFKLISYKTNFLICVKWRFVLNWYAYNINFIFVCFFTEIFTIKLKSECLNSFLIHKSISYLIILSSF